MNGARALDLRGRKALVTGASRGLGRNIATLLARQGARVAVHCRADEAPAREVATGLDGDGHVVLSADLSDPDAAARLCDRAALPLGGLDIVVNNAGIFQEMPHPGKNPDEWRRLWERIIAVNLTAPALICEAAVQYLEASRGHIVNVSSRGAFRGEPESPAYGAAKAGLNQLGQSLAVALAERHVKVITVAPGWVETDMTRAYLEGPGGARILAQFPMGRVVQAGEIAWTVLLAVSGRADSLSGSVIDLYGASYLR